MVGQVGRSAVVAIRPELGPRFGAGVLTSDRAGRDCRVRAGYRRRNTATVPGPGRSTNAAGRRSGRRRKGIPAGADRFGRGARGTGPAGRPRPGISENIRNRWSPLAKSRRRRHNAISACRCRDRAIGSERWGQAVRAASPGVRQASREAVRASGPPQPSGGWTTTAGRDTPARSGTRRGGGRRAGRAPASWPRSPSADGRLGDGRPMGARPVRIEVSRDAEDRSVNRPLFLLIANRNEPSSVQVLSRLNPPVEVGCQVVEIREQGRGMNPIPGEFGEQRRSIRLGDEDPVQGDDVRMREVGER